MPHTTGSAGAEIRPRRNRADSSILADGPAAQYRRGVVGTELLSRTGLSQQIAAQLTSIAHHQLQPGGDRCHLGRSFAAHLARRLPARVGRCEPRYPAGRGTCQRRRRQAAAQRRARRIYVPADDRSCRSPAKLRARRTAAAYFRTSLHDYQKARAQVRYQVAAAFSVSADFNLLNNQNPAAGVHYDYQARQQSLSLLWSPAAGKRFDVQGSYSRSTLRSDIGFLVAAGFARRSSPSIATTHIPRPRY